MKNLFLNWKTTSAGLTMIIGSVVHLAFAIKNHTADESTWTASLIGIIGGIGLVAAGDSTVSATKADTDALATKVELTTTAVKTGDTSILTKPATATTELPKP